MTQKSNLIARIKLWTRFFIRISFRRDFPLVFQAFKHRRKFQIPKQIWSTVDPIKGFLSIKEAGLLYWAAKEWPVAGPVLELGSFEGRSTVLFGLAGRQAYAVDGWNSIVLTDYENSEAVFDHFKQNIQQAGVADMVHIHQGLTHEIGQDWMIPGAILFVDAGHSYEDARDDLDVWTSHLLPGGLLVMHDVLGDKHLGVTRAASEILQEGWQVVASAGSAVAFMRE